MKVTLCLIACIIGYVAANTCSDSMPCTSDVTTCAPGFTLTCKNTGTEMHCVCVNGDQAHTCTNADSCQNSGHQCHQGAHYECTHGHCHCVHQHHGPGGK